MQNNPETSVCVCMTQAGGVAMTLTSCSVVIFVDLGLTPGLDDQAAARAYRLTSLFNVIVYTLSTYGTPEAELARIAERKRRICDTALPPPTAAVPPYEVATSHAFACLVAGAQGPLSFFADMALPPPLQAWPSVLPQSSLPAVEPQQVATVAVAAMLVSLAQLSGTWWTGAQARCCLTTRLTPSQQSKLPCAGPQ